MDNSFSEDEIEKLAPYCRCDYCTTSKFNPMRMFICPCCVGCLKSGKFYAQDNQIKKAIEYSKKEKSFSSFFFES